MPILGSASRRTLTMWLLSRRVARRRRWSWRASRPRQQCFSRRVPSSTFSRRSPVRTATRNLMQCPHILVFLGGREGVYEAVILSHRHKTFEKMELQLEHAVDDHKMSNYRAVINAVRFVQRGGQSPNSPTGPLSHLFGLFTSDNKQHEVRSDAEGRTLQVPLCNHPENRNH